MNIDDYKFIKKHQKMIYKLAYTYSKYSNFDDLYQVGCIGLIKAKENYKEGFNTKFSTYAHRYILGEILAHLRNDKLIKINIDNLKLCKLYEKAKEYLISHNNREPSIKEISEFMGVDELDIYNAIKNNYQTSSIDECITEGLSLHEVIGEDNINQIDTCIDIRSELEKLTDEEKMIINYRYFNDYTQSETASSMGISQVQVSRKENKILSKMKKEIVSY